MTVATNSARFGRVRRTSQTLPCPHLCCVTEGYLQDLSSLAGYGEGILLDYGRMGRAFFADDPGLVRTLTDAGICCALFACSYPFSSCGLCVSVMQVAGWQQKQEWALRWANAPPKEKGEFEERVRQVEVAMSDWRPPPHERVPQVEVAMSDRQPPQVESLRPLSESQPAGEIFCIDLNTDLFYSFIHAAHSFIHSFIPSFIHSCSPFTSFIHSFLHATGGKTSREASSRKPNRLSTLSSAMHSASIQRDQPLRQLQHE